MEITQAQYERIAPVLPVQRGNVNVSNLQVLNAIIYMAEQGCKWRGLPTRFGNWHTIYVRMNRWSKNGVLDRVFEHLQREQIVRIKIEAVALDSTIVKVHPDGTGAPKKGGSVSVNPPVPRGPDHQDSYGCRECSNCHNLCALSGSGPRRTGRPQAADQSRPAKSRTLPAHGPGIPGR